MKKTEFPLKKLFEQDFVNEKWKILFTLKFEQATIEEYDEFMYLPSEKQMEKLSNFVIAQIPLNWKDKILSKMIHNYVPEVARQIDLNWTIKSIVINKFRPYKSIYDDVQIDRMKKTQNRKWLYSANLAWICQKYNISILDLRTKMTLEQYIWMLDGIIFSYNESTKEWQVINKMALIDKEEVAKRAQRTKDLFSTRKKQ